MISVVGMVPHCQLTLDVNKYALDARMFSPLHMLFVPDEIMKPD